MMKPVCLLTSLLACSSAFSQNLVMNGDLEMNTAGTCTFNPTNAQFTAFMSNSFAFGDNDEIDIQTLSCQIPPYLGDVPPSGNWFISLSTNPISLATDGLSLFLSSPLISAAEYHVSFYDKATVVFSESLIDPLEIGVSNDSSSFGTLVHTSFPAATPIGTWAYRSFSFTAPLEARYLTIRNKGLNMGWNFVDAFCVSSSANTCAQVLGTDESAIDAAVRFFPNPFGDALSITVSNQEPSVLLLFDVASRVVLAKAFSQSASLSTAGLGKGVYLYEVRSMSGSVSKGRIVKD